MSEQNQQLQPLTDEEAPSNPYWSKATEEQINRSFTYHRPKNDQLSRYEEIRDTARELANVINRCVPPSREKSTSLTRLEEAVMHANAGIARNE